MVKKYQFVKGLATGVLATAATIAGAVFAVKKQLLILKKKKRLSLKKTAKSSASSCCSLIRLTIIKKLAYHCASLFLYLNELLRNNLHMLQHFCHLFFLQPNKKFK